VLSKDDKSQTENAWTGTGSYYIRTGWWDVNSGKDTYHTYSVNGVPAPVDINAAVTTLQWSDFVWFRDYN
ncbi:MAG: hypothetical protein LBG72_05300, partial [Spirochaetaceae bacterium]|jgi:hypothetical protein|nr:hypothetical protein [Spirochaetaceae bacterium]